MTMLRDGIRMGASKKLEVALVEDKMREK